MVPDTQTAARRAFIILFFPGGGVILFSSFRTLKEATVDRYSVQEGESPVNSFEQNVLSCRVLREQPLAASRDRGYFSSRLRSVSSPGPDFVTQDHSRQSEIK